MDYSILNEEPVRGATGIAKIVGKVMVRLPIDNGIIVAAYHAPEFGSNILSLRHLLNNFEVLFSNSIRNYPGCFFMEKK